MCKKLLLVAAICFGFSFSAAYAWTQKLSPESFNELYALANNGKLGSLQAAAARGLNLNAQNQDGDSGICVAIKRGDIRAYNTFIKAGAHIHPPCINYMSTAMVEDFRSRPQVIKYSDYPTSFQPRESNDWYIVGGVALIASGIAWVMYTLTR